MMTVAHGCMEAANVSAAVLDVLRTTGRHTLERISALAGLTWSQVFGVVDELSRNGTVLLRRVGSEYEVKLNEE
jgi:DNA-binding IclR family transcriptional regulator